ncbi:GTP-binding protein [Synechococcus sp. CS-602]|uniref:GTP-binding protein n=1 Tax=Synechococcaceae TaxID=1890426 RepID=UPI0008FF5588|nr:MULTISPECIES: GTP-binding protein [Synechococcaceae]MCT4364735.1 GTP-binding protein [Candidatus Regnicoccus frigidus MAG-AL1]APD47725.1 ATPase [Synechococcus sp. SynAce01]MCT0201479.1 GTP-binding protein [Synechococcus sp. CS-603]MCT0204793.1 GTP-binding protein [Synechococcus sp. CS-602]MCT0247352.1 GTP-binding protein [Synechococcus sp. CS-601]
MSQILLISGPPGCGKTAWILKHFQAHLGPCGYLRLPGFADEGLQHAEDGGLDQAFLCDQCPELMDLADQDVSLASHATNLLACLEIPQFHHPAESGLAGIDRRLIPQLAALQLMPQCHLHFGRDNELPQQDTLEFSALEHHSLPLNGAVWDPDSLSSFWFELVNGAYGDIFRAKAHVNLPDGRGFLFNWIVSQEGSQFLPLLELESPHGRPTRLSRLVVQGKQLQLNQIQNTINDCLLSDAALELQQGPLRQQQQLPTPSP